MCGFKMSYPIFPSQVLPLPLLVGASSTGVDARAGKKTEALQQVLHRAHDARLLSTYRFNFSDSQAPADVVNALFVRATDDFVDGGRGFDVVFFEGRRRWINSFGASQKLRQQRLGHADGSPVTETIYTHVISEDDRRIADLLVNAVWGVLDANGR
jgi:hypothetical protein